MPQITQPPVDDYIAKSLMTTKGDIIQFSGTDPEVLAIGSDYQIPRRDAATDKLAYVYEGTRLKESALTAHNAGNITVNSAGSAELCELDLGNVKQNDLFLCCLSANIWTSAAPTRGIISCYKKSGTSDMRVILDRDTLAQNFYGSGADEGISVVCTGICKITADGTLVLTYQGISISGAWGSPTPQFNIGVYWLYKQN